jgi:hypothetical protein
MMRRPRSFEIADASKLFLFIAKDSFGISKYFLGISKLFLGGFVEFQWVAREKKKKKRSPNFSEVRSPANRLRPGKFPSGYAKWTWSSTWFVA